VDERHAQDIEDIKNTVHHIERRQYEQDSRIAKVEGRVDAQDVRTHESHARLDARIDSVDKRLDGMKDGIESIDRTLNSHVTQENEDRKLIIREQRKLFWSVMITFGGAILGAILAHLQGAI